MWRIYFKPRWIGLAVLLLCLLDTACTHREWLALPSVEGNPLMAAVLESCGWPAVWLIKCALALAVLALAGPLYRTLAGRLMLWTALAVYCAVCCLHALIALCA